MPGAGPKDANETVHPVNRAELSASRKDAALDHDAGRSAARDPDAPRGDAPSARSAGGEDPDLELVQRTQRGDQAAFRKLFDKYHRRVFAVSLAVVKNPQDANDIVQEAFVRVHRHLGGFQGASSFYTWLYRITMNLSIDHHRRKKNAPAVDYDDAVRREPADMESAAEILPSYVNNDPGKAQSRKELAQRMQAALGTLPPYHQQVIVLREVDGLSYEEIAKIMKVPKGTIMSRLFHARRKMQSALADYVAGELQPQDSGEEGNDGSR